VAVVGAEATGAEVVEASTVAATVAATVVVRIVVGAGGSVRTVLATVTTRSPEQAVIPIEASTNPAHPSTAAAALTDPPVATTTTLARHVISRKGRLPDSCPHGPNELDPAAVPPGTRDPRPIVEHGISPDPEVARHQRRLEPISEPLVGAAA
jgi:hypothetical protein